MKGFKDSTKTCYSMGGYAKGGPKGAAKISKVMGEFKAGTLHSGSKKGPEVKSPKQAVAIALSEARDAGAKIPVKKAMGGPALPAQAAPRATEALAARPALPAQAAARPALPSQARRPFEQGGSVKAAPKKGVPVDSRKPYIPSKSESAGDSALIEMRKRNPVYTPSKSESAGDSALIEMRKKGLGPAAPYKTGGSVKKADGGSTPASDFVASRASQLSRMVGKAEGGKADAKQDKAMIKAAVHKHERARHPGQPLTKLRKGGTPC